MQFTIALFTTLFATAISAAPATPEARNAAPQYKISLTNDQTDANAVATVSGNGAAYWMTDLFRGSAIDNNGAIIATSAQLIDFKPNTRCFFQNYNWIINIDSKATWVDLDGNKDAVIPVYMNGFNIQCQ
ncbi:hypothetical protein BS50DRAFT_570619 [Corynespora cassiicola Philippines]|uniref:Uncharacterized protein n=1 Tax=Corynespora cassiicola Philippines TaxID=1448308 RepID=A0A2T2P1I4_CORCC|nr:hypothetical protein BS50DRAFT_570619 [Corynespora cassiicola Philippines]